MVQPVLIFLLSFVFNVAAKVVTPFLGKFRAGIDAMLFCAIATGFVGGVRSGFAYSFLIAVTYYIVRSKHWDYAAFVIPINMLMGILAGLLNTMPFMSLGLLIFFIYHVLSFILFGIVLQKVGPGYVLFVILNFITTYGLLLLAEPFL